MARGGRERSRRRRDTGARGQYVVGGHAAVRPAALDRANVDVMLASQTPHRRRSAAQRVLGARPRRRCTAGAGARLAVRPSCRLRGHCGAASACGRRRGSAAGGGTGFVDHRDRRSGRDRFAFFDEQFANRSGNRRRNAGVDLVGRDFDEVFVLFDAVADFLSHCATVPSVTVSPSCGIVIVVAIRLLETSPFLASRRPSRPATT